MREQEEKKSTDLDELEKDVHVVEQLGDDVVSTSVHFGLQVLQVLLVGLAVDVALRVAGDADAKVVAVLFADETHQVHTVLEATLGGGPALRASRRICRWCMSTK